MLLNCLRLLFVNILGLFVAVILPLCNKMCCRALNVLMDLRGGSGAEGGGLQIQMVRKETRQSEVLLKKPQGLVWNPECYCSSVNIFLGIYLQLDVVKCQRRFLIQMRSTASKYPPASPLSCPSLFVRNLSILALPSSNSDTFAVFSHPYLWQ